MIKSNYEELCLRTYIEKVVCLFKKFYPLEKGRTYEFFLKLSPICIFLSIFLGWEIFSKLNEKSRLIMNLKLPNF